MTTLTVHHLEQSRSQRVLWLLEELGVDYELRRYARTKGFRAPDELKRIHPLGKSPVITHGERTIAESGPIVEYLLDELGAGQLRPAPGTDAHLRYRYFMHFAEGSMMPPLVVKLITGKLRRAVPLLGKVIAGQIDGVYTDAENRRHLDHVEAELAGREWLAGELSGADVMMSYPVMAALERSGIEGDFPNLRAYVGRIEARPAYARALERGGAPFPSRA